MGLVGQTNRLRNRGMKLSWIPLMQRGKSMGAALILANVDSMMSGRIVYGKV
jgi:hypothetical protein